MPNTGNVDERIVEMQIDHQKFEAGAKKTISILEKLDNALNSLGKNNSDGLDSITGSLEKVTNKFSVMGTIGDQVIRNLTNKAIALVDQMGRVAKSLSIDQVSAGWDKYAEKTQGVQTIMAATSSTVGDRFATQAEQMEWVNEELEKLNWFTDETSYNFLDMVNNIGKFTSNGVELETAVTAMQGISNWAAISGANVGEASRAMYNLSQAMATGSVKLIDWKSIENANMATTEFKETALETAVALGTLEKVGEGTYKTLDEVTKTVDKKGKTKTKTKAGEVFTAEQFNTQLAKGWFTSDVLLQTLDQYGAFTDELNKVYNATGLQTKQILEQVEAYKEGKKVSAELIPYIEKLADAQYELGFRAFRAAQEAKTFEDVINATKDSVSTAWMNLFETIFGDYLTAKKLWSDMAESFYNIFTEPVNKLIEIFDTAFGEKNPLRDKLAEVNLSVDEFEETASNMEDAEIKGLIEQYGSLEAALRAGAVSAELLNKVMMQLQNDKVSSVVQETDGIVDRKIEEIRDAARQFNEGKLTKKEIKNRGLDFNMVKWWAKVYKTADKNDTLEGWTNKFKEQYFDEIAASVGYTEEEIARIKEILADSEGVIDGMQSEEVNRRSGLDLFAEGLMNLLHAIENVVEAVSGAFDIIFGDTNEQGEVIYGWIERFNKFTEGVKSATEDVEGLSAKIAGILSIFHSIAAFVKGAFRLAFHAAFTVVAVVASLLLEVFGVIQNSGVIQAFGSAITTVFQAILVPLSIIGGLIKDLFDKLFGNKLKDIDWAERLAYYLNVISVRVSIAASRFARFLKSKAVADALTNAFEKVSDVVIKVATAFSNGYKKLKAFVDLMKLGYEKNGMAGVFEALNARIEVLLRNHPILLKVFQTIRSVFGSIGSVVSAGYNAIVNWFSAFDFSDLQKYIPTMESIQEFFNSLKEVGLFGAIADKISNIFTAISNFFSGTKIDTSGVTNAFETVKTVFTTIFEALFGNPDDFKERVKNSVLNIFEGIKEALSQITFADVLQSMRLAGLATMITEIAGIFATFRDIEKEVKGIPESISKMFGNLGDAFKNLGVSFKTNALLKVLVGVGILAASLYALSQLDEDRLTHTAVVVGLLFFVIYKITENSRKINLLGGNNIDVKKFQVFSDLAGALIGIALVIFAVGSAITRITKAINTFGVNNVGIAAGILAGFLVGVALIVGVLFVMTNKLSTYKRMDAVGNTLMKLAASMYIISLALGALVVPIILLAAAIRWIDTNGEVGQAALDLAGFAVVLSLIMFGLVGLLSIKTNTPAKIEKMGTALLKIAGAMYIVASAIGSLAVPLLLLAAGIRWIQSENGNELGKAAAWMAVFALVLGVIIGGILAFLSSKNMKADKISAIGTTILKIAGSMVLIALAIGMLAAPLIAIGTAIKLLGSENMGQAFNAMLVFAVIMGVLAGIAVLAGKFGNPTGMILAAAAMAILAIGINFLVPALIAFIGIGASLAALAVNIENFWEAAKRLGALAGIMLVFGAGIALAGIGIAAFGLGIIGAGVGAIVFAAALWILSKALGGLSEVFPNFIASLANAGETIKLHWKEIALGTAAFVALAIAIGLLIRSVGKLVDIERFGNGFSSFAASLAAGVGRMISGVGNKIVEMLPKLIPILGTILVLVALHLIDMIPELTHLMVTAIVTLFNSIATEFESRADEIIDSISRIVAASLHVIAGVIDTIFGEDFWNSLNLTEKILLGLASTGMAIGILKNVVAPFKVFGSTLNTHVVPATEKVATGISSVVSAAGGLPAVLGPLLAVAVMAAYALDQVNKQQGILKDNAFEGLSEDANGYEEAIAKTEARIKELQEQEQSGWGTELSFQELNAQQVLLAQLKAEYAELQKQKEEALNNSENGSEPTSSASPQVDVKTTTDDIHAELEKTRAELEAEFAEFDFGSIFSSDVVSGVENGGTDITSTIVNTLTGAADTAANDSGISSSSFTAGFNVSSGVADGIFAGMPGVNRAMAMLSNNIVAVLPKRLQIHSPSRVMAALAAYIPAGIAKGVEENSGVAVDSMTVLGSSIIAAMQMAMLRVATVADENFEFSPTITPVVDMSNVAYAAGNANQMFGSISSGLRGSMRITTENAANTAAMVRYGTGSTGVVDEIQNLSSKLDMLGEAVANMQIVLDTGELVGATSHKMDNAFGEMQVHRGRGN